MQARTPLSAALAIGLVVAPAALRQSHHGSRTHATASARTAGRYGSRSGDTTNTRTITWHAILTGPVTATSAVVTPLRHGRHGGSTPPAPVTITLDSNTTLSTVSNPAASWTNLTIGDEVIITWTVPDGTSPVSVPAMSVADVGAPAPVRYVVHGITTGAGSSSGVTITLTTDHSRRHREHHHWVTTTTSSSTPLSVSFDTNTVFVQSGTTSPNGSTIAAGDRVTIVWMAPPGHRARASARRGQGHRPGAAAADSLPRLRHRRDRRITVGCDADRRPHPPQRRTGSNSGLQPERRL